MLGWMPRCTTVFLGLAVLQICRASGGPALIVNDGTVGLETSVTSNLSTHLTTAGYTVTTNVGVPGGSLATYKQIWDVRYNNTTPLSPSDITAYVAYMAGGGSLFVMGENVGFVTRDNSIISLVQAAGGGTITVVSPTSDTQTVQSPFTGPNAITTVTYLASAGVPAPPGHGADVSKDSSNIGASVVFGPGNMTNAASGTLILVFDVNFLDPGSGADANTQLFTDNLIAFLAAPVAVTPPSTSVPTLSEWGVTLLACALLFVGARKVANYPISSFK